MSCFKSDSLFVEVYHTDRLLGCAASDFVAAELASAVQKNGAASLILATGASQFTFLDAFKKDRSVDWGKITVFHLDEYRGMSERHPASFRRYLRERVLDEVRPAKIHFLAGDAKDIGKETLRYENLLKSAHIDVACIGIGENGHIAFNDPAVADFDDRRLVKVVELDEACRRQQLGEGWFRSLDEVPIHALSLTIPAIMNSKVLSCVVPDRRKAKAVLNTLCDPISTACPATILRKHPRAHLFLDRNSASLLAPERLADVI
ncbi:MAG: glucosamine-6-phosphate deaminase [Verrucomicrobiota bacterium]|jgi:glucosamine-6-phosphate deaminase